MSSDNYEERNVSDATRKERFASMERVMNILYCRYVFHDFRKPVEVMYPHLAQSYHSLIKRPMDLGSLLLKTMRQEIVTIQEFRTNLQLVHNNALLYNEGAPLMEAVSRHLELFSQGLFEELMRFPYYPPAATATKAITKPADYQSIRLDKRRKRFVLVRDQALSNSEMKRVFELLNELTKLAPESLCAALEQARHELTERLAWNAHPDVAAFVDAVPSPVTLTSLLSPIILAACTAQASPAKPHSSQVLVESFCESDEALVPRADCETFLAALENCLGELSVLQEERLLRGTAYSSIWAAPSSMFVYAQSISMTATSSEGRSRSPWWPCVVIACDTATCRAHAECPGGSTCTSNTYGMQPEVLRANLARIPADVLKQLNKLRPRTHNVSAAAQLQLQAADHADAVAGAGAGAGTAITAANGETANTAADSAVAPSSTEATTGAPLVIPQGYLLLEYFGAHDFGWVKAESVTPMYTYTETSDGSTHIRKNAAPGKLCHKDIVAEAAEAWISVQKQHRRDGLYRKSALVPTAMAVGLSQAQSLSNDSSEAAVTSAETSSAGAMDEGEDISFAAPAAAVMPGTAVSGEDTLSQDTEGDDEGDLHDLPYPPSVGELEDSVEVPFSNALFESSSSSSGGGGGGVGAVVEPVHPANGSASKSRSSGGRSRKSSSGGASEADHHNPHNKFDDLPAHSAAPSTARKSLSGGSNNNHNNNHNSNNNGMYFAPDREDKRLYYASAEELLRYRAHVEYLLPEDVTLEDFKNCVDEGKFKTSRCPLPLPSMQSESNSPVKAKAPPLPLKDMRDELIVVDPSTQATFRPKALLRTRALSYFLNCARPLHLEHYSATPSKKGFPSLPPSLPRTAGLKGTDGNNSDAALLMTTDTDAQVLLSGVEDANKKKTGTDIVLPGKPEKRKYVFKNRPVKISSAPVVPASEEGTNSEVAPDSLATAAATTATAVVPSAAPSATAVVLPPINAANIHVPANLTLSASCFLLDAGCSRYAAGDGSVYTRSVNTEAKVFHLEARTCQERKRILREELDSLKAAIEALVQVSKQRQQRDSERKIRFQQLQQQQLQQQLHQQQHALLAQQEHQQHQQYLMQLIERQHLLEQNGLKKGLLPKQKVQKATATAPSSGAVSAPSKSRSRPVVMFTAAGQPTIVRTSDPPSTASASASASASAAPVASNGNSSSGSSGSGNSSTGSGSGSNPVEGGPAQLLAASISICVPRKKSRLGDIDLSKATILTAQQHAAEQPKHPNKRAKVKLPPARPSTNPRAAVAYAASAAASAAAAVANAAASAATTTAEGSASTTEGVTATLAAALSTPPPATNALDFLASVAMESTDVDVRDNSLSRAHEDLVGYKRSFGSFNSPAAEVNEGEGDSCSESESAAY